ncbi:MAG: hypothetical protein LBL36_07615, partial [Clostridiales Family XIII bacterium]|nr:hypothetical protein [Clostridiales Family XIII bacterium]
LQTERVVKLSARIAAVRGYLPGADISTVVGVLADKDFDAMLRHLYWFSGHMFLTQPPNDRALEPAELADRLSRVTAELSCGCGDPACLRCSAESGPFSTVFSAPEDALNAAITRAQHSERGAVVVCGSLYLISAVRGLLM